MLFQRGKTIRCVSLKLLLNLHLFWKLDQFDAENIFIGTIFLYVDQWSKQASKSSNKIHIINFWKHSLWYLKLLFSLSVSDGFKECSAYRVGALPSFYRSKLSNINKSLETLANIFYSFFLYNRSLFSLQSWSSTGTWYQIYQLNYSKMSLSYLYS